MPSPHDDLEKENARLRKEVKLLRKERGILKKTAIFFVNQKMKRFAFIDVHKKMYSIEALCRVMQVSSGGFRAW